MSAKPTHAAGTREAAKANLSTPQNAANQLAAPAEATAAHIAAKNAHKSAPHVGKNKPPAAAQHKAAGSKPSGQVQLGSKATTINPKPTVTPAAAAAAAVTPAEAKPLPAAAAAPATAAPAPAAVPSSVQQPSTAQGASKPLLERWRGRRGYYGGGYSGW